MLDTEGVGHLTPGSLAMAMRDVYDLVGMLDAGDPHKDAMELYHKMGHGSDCRYRCFLTRSEGLHFKK